MFRHLITSAVMLGMAAAGSVAAAMPASAAPGASYPCGYDSYHGGDAPLYNHCGRGPIVLKVDHWFWQTTYDCVAPGVHRIDQGNSHYAIIGAEADCHACTSLGPIVGP